MADHFARPTHHAVPAALKAKWWSSGRSHFARILLGVLASAVGISQGAQEALKATPDFDGQSFWGYVKVLADDNMEGRQVGSPGLRRAQDYVIEQFKKSGLAPAGSEGFWQSVPFVQRNIDEQKSSLALVRDGVSEPLELGADGYFNLRVPSVPNEVTAPLVFIGNGLRVPEVHHDDLAGIDLRGKIVVFIAGSPESVTTALSGHYSSPSERAKLLHEVGAIGYITIPNPASMDIPWIRMTASRTAPAMDLADPAFAENTGMQLALTWNPARADKLFAGSGHTFQEIAALAKERKPLPCFPLTAAVRAQADTHETALKCANLVARLPGSDPKLKDEYVVLSAHLDHLGVGAPVNGDRIYNGALDNASGVAVLLDLAAAWHSHPLPLRRSVLFVVLTAEEKGLLGSKFFARRPTVPRASLVADINFDMFLPIFPLKALKVAGLAESDLGELTREAAKTRGVEALPDPEPLRNTFIRSDQYNFIKEGIPAVKIDFGYEVGSPEQKMVKDWLTQRYHAPSDDLSQPVDLPSAGRYEGILQTLVSEIANRSERPQWKTDSFFRRYAAPKTAAAKPTAGTE